VGHFYQIASERDEKVKSFTSRVGAALASHSRRFASAFFNNKTAADGRLSGGGKSKRHRWRPN
jgi:hypothetical protein